MLIYMLKRHLKTILMLLWIKGKNELGELLDFMESL